MAHIPVSGPHTAVTVPNQNYTPALPVLAVLYFMMGLITCLNDTLVPFFKNSFNLTYTQSALVQFYFFFTYGIMSVPAGWLVEKIGFKRAMVTGFLVAAIGTFLFFPASMMHKYYFFLAALFILAIGVVLLQVAANPFITILGPARTASSRLTLIQGVGALGTTIAPLLGTWLILNRAKEFLQQPGESLRLPYLCITGFLVLIALVVSRINLPKISTHSETGKGIGTKIFRFRNLKFGVIALFCYVGAEVSIGSFLTNYISDTLTISENQANSFVAFYWGGMLVGRFIGAALLRFLRAPLVLTFCVLMAILLILFSVNSSGSVAVWTMTGVGLCNSVMFATIFSLAVTGVGKYATKASGWLSTAIVGGAVVSFFQGWLIDHFNWTVAFMLPLACYFFILFFALNGYKPKADLRLGIQTSHPDQ
ncbi:sugar MFS transporter [Dyadobacter frigoris]|uniref:Sugar MFS transporter n=1 Tax=Dyadobacter frigoris TaxID=2576211 RepID=A0A4U6CS98_9BACT|nr:sugar MFS transporter [Dyadobacter frigoris]TKT86555.1 sugar MFS transporter [Dyadobacter frigoris]